MFKFNNSSIKSRIRFSALSLLAASAIIAAPECMGASVPNRAHSAVKSRSLLFAGPDSVSKFYRIPAIAALPDGTIAAVADRRLVSNADLPNPIDVVCRTSFDGGTTWTDAVVVALNDEGGGYGDPALGYDPASGDLVSVFTHGEGLWTAEPGKHAYIYTSRSADGGLTWSTPKDITADIFSQTKDAAPVHGITVFATSGGMHTAPDGTMWFALVTRHNEKEKYGPMRIHAVKSSDGGQTWTSEPFIVDEDADESKIVSTADGSLLMSIRNRRKGNRKFARSDDGGKTWAPAELSTTLPDPACNGDIIALPDGRLLHSINDSATDRHCISLFISEDHGKTWEKLIELTPKGVTAAYSAMTLIDPLTLGVLTEEANAKGGLRIWFTKIDLPTLLGNSDHTPW
ncbi:MAG: exo-alpha-sialidase [Bacteroidales bacterium]|nr:exo-alpha-sialidase [Bacteroidales bacterium]